MENDFALFVMGDMLKTALIIASPLLGTTLVIGLLISIFQVVTQIQEMTLTFVPKIVASVGALAIFGPWMLSTLVEYTKQLFMNIPNF
ncbi:MAG: flagellar biosynthesis protein FliQ [Pseudomonadota bacterium]